MRARANDMSLATGRSRASSAQTVRLRPRSITAWEYDGVKHGDGAFHPGIAVAWTLGEGGPLAPSATACSLLDGAPRPR